MRTVAKPSPKLIVTAMEAKKASGNSGAIPKIVVTAAMATGRRRRHIGLGQEKMHYRRSPPQH